LTEYVQQGLISLGSMQKEDLTEHAEQAEQTLETIELGSMQQEVSGIYSPRIDSLDDLDLYYLYSEEFDKDMIPSPIVVHMRFPSLTPDLSYRSFSFRTRPNS
jgi:hypothetical protein